MLKQIVLMSVAFAGVCYGQADSYTSRFYTQAGFLYWKTNVNGLAYAVEASPSSIVLGRGSVHTPAFGWGPGFNVGLGYRIPHDAWKIDLQFTSYRTHCTTLLHSEEDRVLLPVWTSPSSGGSGTFMRMSQHYRLHLGFVDLLLSKQLPLTPRITVSPSIGISYFSVRQKYHLNYSDPDDPIAWSMKNKFWGLGPSMGCSGEISLFKGFSLFGNVAVKLPYGQFYTHQGERLEKRGGKQLRLFDRFSSVAPVAAGTLGFRFQTPVSNRGKQWNIEIGYDQMLLFAQNQLPHFVQSSSPGLIVANSGDLSIRGAHLTVGFAF